MYEGPHLTIEDRLMALASEVAEVKRLLASLLQAVESEFAEIKSRLDTAADDHRKEWFTVPEFAEAVDRKIYTVREWCRYGRIEARKREDGRSLSGEWEISRAELDRYRNHGLRPRRVA